MVHVLVVDPHIVLGSPVVGGDQLHLIDDCSEGVNRESSGLPHLGHCAPELIPC